MRLLCAVLLTASFASAQQFSVDQLKQQPLTNENVVTLAKAGFDELFILQLMHSSRTNFDTSVQGLVVLKQAGVSEELIRQMAMPQAMPPAPPAGPKPPAKAPPKKHGLFKRSSPPEDKTPPTS
jgi:hypothetical protein